MFWMFLVNALGMITMFGFFFYLLLITQKGGLFATKPGETLAFFVRSFSSWGVKRTIVRSRLPGHLVCRPKKVAEICDCSLYHPGTTRRHLVEPGTQRTIVRSDVTLTQLRPRPRCRCSVSAFGVGIALALPTWLQVIFERTLAENIKASCSKKKRTFITLRYTMPIKFSILDSLQTNILTT